MAFSRTLAGKLLLIGAPLVVLAGTFARNWWSGTRRRGGGAESPRDELRPAERPPAADRRTPAEVPAATEEPVRSQALPMAAGAEHLSTVAGVPNAVSPRALARPPKPSESELQEFRRSLRAAPPPGAQRVFEDGTDTPAAAGDG